MMQPIESEIDGWMRTLVLTNIVSEHRHAGSGAECVLREDQSPPVADCSEVSCPGIPGKQYEVCGQLPRVTCSNVWTSQICDTHANSSALLTMHYISLSMHGLRDDRVQ